MAGGVWGDRRAPAPITGSGGGVGGLGGVSDKYKSIDAYCIQDGE